MRHPLALAFEQQLKTVFDQIDHELEARYGTRHPLRPNRPGQHATGNPEMDGLFNVGAAFTAGFGSTHGQGYVVEIRIATLELVSAELQNEIELEVVQRLNELLPTAFPGRSLTVQRDGHVFKITGDLSLGLGLA